MATSGDRADAALFVRCRAAAAGTTTAWQLSAASQYSTSSVAVMASIAAAPCASSQTPNWTLKPGDGGISIGCWSLECHRGPISSAAEIDAFVDETAVKPPEMVFLANHLTVTHLPTGAAISFNTRDALRGCLIDRSKHVSRSSASAASTASTASTATAGTHSADGADSAAAASSSPSSPLPASALPARDAIRVTHAAQWAGKEHDVSVQTLQLAYDWTYTTHYHATVTPPPPPHALTYSEHSGPLPLALLQRPDPILWFAQLPLYEDELHDNGVCSVSVKARVMASCWLVLMQCWLRVDDVCVKVYETRLYCEHMEGASGSGGGRVELIREWQAREETFESLASRGMPRDSKSYTDPSFVARKLPIVAMTRELITIQTST